MTVWTWLAVAVIAVIVLVDWCCLETARRHDNTEEV